MNPRIYLKNIATFLSLLIISMPIAFSEEMHLVVNKNGALVTGDGYFRECNEYNQLIKIYNGSSSNPSQLLQEYFYHPIQEKIAVKKTYENGTWKETIYYVNDNYIEIENSSGTFSEKYLYIDGQLVAQVDANGNKFSVHGDHLGSVSMIVNASGDVVETSFYDPFGSVIEGGTKSRFDYEGKEFDSVVQDRDFGFRKQNGQLPFMWNQPDTLIQDVYDPQSLNRYAFERSNPYRYTDPSGHCIEDFCIFEGLLIVLAAYMIGQFQQAVLDAEVKEAEKTGDEEEIARAKRNFNLGFFKSGLQFLFPESALVQMAGLIDTASSATKSFELVKTPSYEQRISIRNDVIQEAINNVVHGVGGSGSSSSGNGANPFGVGDLIQRWLRLNPDKLGDLNSIINTGGGSGNRGSTGTRNNGGGTGGSGGRSKSPTPLGGGSGDYSRCRAYGNAKCGK